MDDTESLLPSYQSGDRSRTNHNRYCQIQFPKFAVITVGLPFNAFIFCVYWSTVYNFREATATHCQVDNYLPSLSAAIGSFSPQTYVWNCAIIIHFWPRWTIAGLYYKYLSENINKRFSRMVYVTKLLNLIEISSLLGLTLVSSTFFYPAHAFFFVTFVLTSIVYMMFSCFLLKWKRVTPASRRERISLHFKFLLTFTTLSGFFLAGYHFVRHNTYCEAGVYSLFALFEYVVVLSNMAFHMTAFLDFRRTKVYFSSAGIFYR